MTSSAITRDEMKQWLEALIQDFWLGRRESHEPIMKAILADRIKTQVKHDLGQ